MIYVLAFSLLILLLIAYKINKKDIVAPSFIFTLSFLFSSIWAVFFADIWELDSFHTNTYFVIVGGVLVFILQSIIIKAFFKKKTEEKVERIQEIKIDYIIKVLCLLFMLVTIYLCLSSVLSVVGGNYGWSNIFAAIERYDYLCKFSKIYVSINTLANMFKNISTAMTYWYIYVIINNYICCKKKDMLSILIVILGLIISMTTGSRNGAVNMLLSIPAIILLLQKKSNAFKFKLSHKQKIALITIPMCLLVLFPRITNLVGRKVTTTNSYYLAIYCGAQIKNLDTFLQEYDMNVYTNKNNMTFRTLIIWLNQKTGNSSTYKYDLPFRYVNGNNLGNVYTSYSSYIYDYGYAGMIILVMLMSAITQIVYEKGKKSKLTNKPNISILIYGYMFSSIILAFYSNKFYEQNFNIMFVYMIIFWLFFNQVFIKVKTKKDI